jgi:hypothetical protein
MLVTAIAADPTGGATAVTEWFAWWPSVAVGTRVAQLAFAETGALAQISGAANHVDTAGRLAEVYGVAHTGARQGSAERSERAPLRHLRTTRT